MEPHHYPPFPSWHGQDGPEFMTVDGMTFPKNIQLNAGGQVLDITMEKITINGKVSKKAFKVD